MTTLKVVLLSESDSFNQDVPLPYKYYGQKLWDTIRTIVTELKYGFDIVELHKLDFQEHESITKFLNADIVIMVRLNLFFISNKIMCNIYRMLQIKIVVRHLCIIKAIEKVLIAWMISY
jgi:hypothetical protein